MSEQLSSGQIQELREDAAGNGTISSKDVLRLIWHIDALTQDRDYWKDGELQHTATIRRIRELANSWVLEQEEAEYTEPELLSLDIAAHEIIDEINGGTK